MERIEIQESRATPYVLLDEKETCRISGKSYPENAFDFYSPLLSWIEERLSALGKNEEFKIIFEFVYFNTSSSKAILDIFDLCEAASQAGKTVKIEWRYEAENDVMKECGEEFQEDFEVDIKIIENE